MKKWQHPDNYFGETYENYFVLLGQSRDSDILEQSNFSTALERLGGEDGANVIVARARHWACGWVEFIGILDVPTNQEKIDTGNQIESDLSNYPILSDDDYYTRQNDYAREYWDSLDNDEKKELKQKHRIKTKSNKFHLVMREDDGALMEYLTTDA